MIISVNEELSKIEKNLWLLYYNDFYINIGGGYAIRVTRIDSEIWFEVDSEPMLVGCYIYATNNLKDCLSWCYDNLDLDFEYY